jgi:hypothetical protein
MHAERPETRHDFTKSDRELQFNFHISLIVMKKSVTSSRSVIYLATGLTLQLSKTKYQKI